MSKFGDIGSKSRRHIDPTALQQVVNGGQVAIKKKAAQEKAKKSPLQVMLDPETKNSIKALAASKGISMTELFEDMYRQYRETMKS